MRTGRVLASALQLLVSFKLMILGAVLIILPFLPYAKSVFLDFFIQNPGFFSLIGYFTLAFGVLLFIAFYAVNRGQYYQVKMKGQKLSVDIDLIQNYATIYWKNLFPEHSIETEVLLHSDQKIELIAQMPEISFQKQQKLLKDIEKELGILLAEKLGYEQDFFVTLLLK